MKNFYKTKNGKIGIIVTISLIIIVAIIIGVVSGTKSSSHSPDTPTNLTNNEVKDDINNYLKADTKPWYYGTDQTKITFTLDKDGIKRSSGEWIATLDPSRTTTTYPAVNLSLNWTKKANDGDIPAQIIKDGKYSHTQPLTQAQVANAINDYLLNDGKPWYYDKNPTPIAFFLYDDAVGGSRNKWTATLCPSKNKKTPKVKLSLIWTTKADDNDITTQITSAGYFHTLTKDEVTKVINDFLTNDTTPWYYSDDKKDKVHFTLVVGSVRFDDTTKVWKATLKSTLNVAPMVELNLPWTTKANKSNITDQITKNHYLKS